MDYYERKLNAKVKAVNRAHSRANVVALELHEFFKPYVGQEVLKVDGTFFAKIKVPQYENTNSTMIYRSANQYTLNWVVKTSEQDSENTCMYYEVGVYVAELDRKFLVKLLEPQTLRCDYTLEEITEKRNIHKELRRQADAAKSALWPFGENDY